MEQQQKDLRLHGNKNNVAVHKDHPSGNNKAGCSGLVYKRNYLSSLVFGRASKTSRGWREHLQEHTEGKLGAGLEGGAAGALGEQISPPSVAAAM